MAKVEVVDGNLSMAMKKFTRIMSETRKTARNYTFYLRPGLKAKEKQKMAARHKAKRRYYY